MLQVDRKTGSKELIAPLQAYGLDVDECDLPFGDIAFSGRGVGGAHLYIGIEFKKVEELVGSFVSERFQGWQLPGMTNVFDRRYLLVEGAYHHDAQGRLCLYRGRALKAVPGGMQASEFDKRLLNLQTRGGMWLHHTTGRRDSVRWLLSCYRYWTDQDLDRHKSHLAVYAPDVDSSLGLPMSDFRKAIKLLLPGVGFTASRALEKHFGGSVRKLTFATVAELAELEIPDEKGKVRRLGEARARKAYEALG